MLNSFQLEIAISAVLAGAVIFGWVLHWLWVRAISQTAIGQARIADLVQRLHTADNARAQAEEARREAEERLAACEADASERIGHMQVRLDGAIEGREAELEKALRGALADAEAGMDGLRHARIRIAELEAQIASGDAVDPEPTDAEQNAEAQGGGSGTTGDAEARLREQDALVADLREQLATLQAVSEGAEDRSTKTSLSTRQGPVRPLKKAPKKKR